MAIITVTELKQLKLVDSCAIVACFVVFVVVVVNQSVMLLSFFVSVLIVFAESFLVAKISSLYFHFVLLILRHCRRLLIVLRLSQ